MKRREKDKRKMKGWERNNERGKKKKGGRREEMKEGGRKKKREISKGKNNTSGNIGKKR